MDKSIKKIILVFIMYFTFVTFSHGFYSYYFLSIAKIPILQYTIGKSLWFLSVFFLEIPSGYISDKIGQKRVFMLSLLFSTTSYVLFMNSNHTYLYFIGEIIWGCANALASGTIEAMIFNRMKDQKIFSKVEILITTIQMLNVALGIMLVNIFKNQIWLFPIVGLISTFILSIYLLPKHEITNYENSFKQDLKYIKNYLKDIELLYFFNWILIIMAFAQIIFNYWQEWLALIVKQQVLIFILSVLIFISQMLGNILSKKFTNLKVLTILTIVIFVIPIISNFNIYTLLFSIYASQFLRGIISPNLSFNLNQKIENKYRSTFLSISSMITNVGSFITLTFIVPHLLGKSVINIFTNSWYFGLVLTLILLVSMFIKHKNSENKNKV